MRRLASFLACMLLLVVATAGAAHAAELSSCGEPARAEMVLHVAGDCDEVQADSHKAYPHHHDGCHAQHMSAAFRYSEVLAPMMVEPTYGASRAAAVLVYQGEMRLRPPRA